MSRSYPIYNRVGTVGGRKTSSDFGAGDSFTQTILVGTSAKNSHELATITVGRHVSTHGSVTFSMWLDGNLIKRAHLVGKDLQKFSIDQYVDLGDVAADLSTDALSDSSHP